MSQTGVNACQAANGPPVGKVFLRGPAQQHLATLEPEVHQTSTP